MREPPVEVATVDTGVQELAPFQEFQNFGGGRTARYHLEFLVRVNTGCLGVGDPELT